MKSVKVLRAAAFRALNPQIFDGVIPLELVEAVREQYGFKRAPDVTKPNEPIDFQLGKLKSGNITIEQLVVTSLAQLTSIGVAVRTTTDDADLILDDLIGWVSEKFGVDKTIAFPSAYHNQLEFAFDRPISAGFARLQEIGSMITNLVVGYGLKECPTFELGSFSMHFDTTKTAALKPLPTLFAIERRVGSSWTDNKYFSPAPLKTKDHKAVLEQLERILLA